MAIRIRKEVATDIVTAPPDRGWLFIESVSGQLSFKDDAGVVHSLFSVISSVFGRTGAVVAVAGDYAIADITGLVAALAAKQPLDSDLTAIAALTTTSFGRALLALADAAAGRTAFGLGTAAVLDGDTDVTLAANSDLRFATQKAVKAYIASVITGGASDVMIFKGVINCSANPNYPAADAGHVYKVSVAGKIGGGSGPNVEAGDTLYCITDSTSSGTQAGVGANWVIAQLNIDGAVTGPASATNNAVALFDGTTGKLLKDSTFAYSDAGLPTSDITTNNVSTTKHGFAPRAPNDATKFLDGTGAYSTPASGASTLDALSDVTVPAPTIGDVLVWSGSAWVNTPPSALASGTGRWDPCALRPGQSASALDDDWSNTGTTLSGVWTGNANWPPTAFDINTTKPGKLYIRGAASSTTIKAILQAIPAGDFAIQCEITCNPNTGNLSRAELLFTDGTGGSANCIILCNYQDGTGRSAVQSGTIASIGGNIISPLPWGLNPAVFRLERTSGSYTGEISPDGISGWRFSLSPGFTATHFGISGTPFGGELRATYGAFRYSATATTRWGKYL